MKQMQDKIVMAGKIQDIAIKQAEELRKAQIEMERKKREQEALQQKIQEQEEEKMMIQNKFSSLAEEVTVKSKRITKLVKYYKELKQEAETNYVY